MLIYVAHQNGGPADIEEARQTIRRLQINDLQNCYICPLTAFSYLGGDDIGGEEEMALRLDLISVCDCLIVSGSVSQTVRREIEFAQKIHMEVRYDDH